MFVQVGQGNRVKVEFSWSRGTGGLIAFLLRRDWLSPLSVPQEKHSQTDKQMRKEKREITENKELDRERQRRESGIGRANSVWVQRDSRDVKTGRLRKKGRAEGC